MAAGMNEGVTARWFFRKSLRERQIHGTRLATADTVQAYTLSLLAHTQLAPPMHVFLY